MRMNVPSFVGKRAAIVAGVLSLVVFVFAVVFWRRIAVYALLTRLQSNNELIAEYIDRADGSVYRSALQQFIKSHSGACALLRVCTMEIKDASNNVGFVTGEKWGLLVGDMEGFERGVCYVRDTRSYVRCEYVKHTNRRTQYSVPATGRMLKLFELLRDACGRICVIPGFGELCVTALPIEDVARFGNLELLYTDEEYKYALYIYRRGSSFDVARFQDK